MVREVPDQLRDNLKQASSFLWHHLNSMESLLQQKSRHKWINKGDYNSTLFHKSMNYRFRVNMIMGLESPSIWIEKVEEVKFLAKSCFELLFLT